MHWQDAANVLWCRNHETRRGERGGDLMTAHRQGGPASHISPLCGTLLSAERSRTTPNSSHVLFIACPAAHDSEEYSDICSWLHLGLIFCLTMHVYPLVSFSSSFVYAQPKEEPSAVPVSGCVWSGSRLLALQDLNSALRDSYFKPTHSSIKPWTTSPFLD